MKPHLFLKVTAVFILFSVCALHADWQWENDLAVATPTPKGYEARLSFQNNGKSNVTVTGLAFSCPCTVYHFTATTARPGGTGTLSLVFESEKEGLEDTDLSVIAIGSPSTKPRELTIRLENTGPGT